MTDPATSTAVPATDGDQESLTSGLVPKWLENLAALGWRVFVIAALLVVFWLLASVLWVVTASIARRHRDRGLLRARMPRDCVRAAARERPRPAIVWVVALAIVGGALLLLALAHAPVRRRARCGTWTTACNGSRPISPR